MKLIPYFYCYYSLSGRLLQGPRTGFFYSSIPPQVWPHSCSLSGCCTSGTGSSSRAFFDQGPELLRQVPIQEVQRGPDPFPEPRRNSALPAQIFFQIFDLHFELPVFIFKPLPLLGLLQLFFSSRGFSAEAVGFLPSAPAPSALPPRPGSPPPSAPSPAPPSRP